MKFTLVLVIFIAAIFYTAECSTKEFKFGGWSGVVESFGKIDGKETDNHEEMSSKAEQAIKKLIEKHLSNKKKNQKQGAKGNKNTVNQKEKLPENPTAEIPRSINWDDNKEARDLINQKVTGGTQAINDIINLLKEQQAPSSN